MRPPGEHDPGEPHPRANAGEHHVGGCLEQEIAEEEQAGAKAIGGFGHAERVDHLQLGI
ncbi:hypothetical protein LRS12_15885 [Sphingomonas sp. J344]|uniref:hypothetical protein n=1 Tax=Sphingomonas sp. J344 TaxID=2898434 RepID=UPI002151AB4B|nr:hypothetical protein [Sphingomonas sp. J344]MCR5872057.1 hypothetical protein [Sphingomonas sp. J344]